MKKRSVLTGLWLVLLIMVLAACGSHAQTSKRTSITVMQTTNLQTMDPAHGRDVVTTQTMMDVYSGLYRYNNKQLEPDMAADMATTTNKQRTYTFRLRKNARWSDGHAVTAQDFVYAWRRAVSPQTGSQYAYAFADIVNASAISAGQMPASKLGVTAVDRTTLRVHLTKAVPYFESMLTMSVFDPVEHHQVTKYGRKYGQNAQTLTFNGPYRLTKWAGTGQTRWVETKNPTYWHARQVHLKRISYRVVKSSNKALTLFRDHQLDDVTLSGTAAHKARSMAGYHTVKQNISYYLELNQSRVPALRNHDVRQALSMTVDRAQLVDHVLGDGSQPIATVVPAGMFYNEQSGNDFASVASAGVTRYSQYDRQRARALFKAGMAASGQTHVDLTLMGDDTDEAQATLRYLQQAIGRLSQTGATIDVHVAPLSMADRLARLQSGDFDVALAAWSADYPDPVTFLSLFTTGNSNNHGGWSNATYDQLVQAAQTTDAGSVTRRWDDLVKADQLLTREVGAVPLYQVGQSRVTDTALKGVNQNPNGLINWATAYYR